jgi:hypothetical protein
MDFDSDGDLDVLIGQWGNRRYQLYRNNGSDHHWLRVSIEGTETQTPVGTQVRLLSDGTTRTRTYTLRSDYQSQDSSVLHFGLGRETTVDRLEIRWPDGRHSVYRNVSTDQHLVVTYPSSENRSARSRRLSPGRHAH